MVNQGFIELGQKVDLCIPTGNFGNILSAIYAKTMLDVPYDRIICASNDNKVLHDFFSTGIYDLRQRNLIKTISPAIDILISSNLERLLWTHLGAHRVNELMTSLAQDRYFQIKSKELEMIFKFPFESSTLIFCLKFVCKEALQMKYVPNIFYVVWLCHNS